VLLGDSGWAIDWRKLPVKDWFKELLLSGFKIAHAAHDWIFANGDRDIPDQPFRDVAQLCGAVHAKFQQGRYHRKKQALGQGRTWKGPAGEF
jgi:hypothetical protein